jgi:4-hydroxymandelate oxidase
MSEQKLNRRQALGSVGAIVAGTVAGSALGGKEAPAAQRERAPWEPALTAAQRLAPREELVNLLEYEEEAKKKLQPATFALIAGGDRGLFDRITLRPRMNIPTTDMDLTVNLFGEDHFTPIIIAPIADQKRVHPDAELATAKGAAAGKALMIVSSRSSVPLADIAPVAQPSFWYQVYASDSSAKTQVQDAAKAGAKAIVITVGASHAANGSRAATASSINWSAVDAIRQNVTLPVIVKGITTPAEATSALQHNVQGIIASNFGGLLTNKDAMILALPNIVDAVGGKVPVLTDGSFRRGTDIFKALAFGAKGALLGRPVMWGLAAYGEAGVQSVVEMAQTELGRYMGMCGRPNLKALDRTAVKVHGPIPTRTATNN